jgi:hypothetical protein
LGGREVILRYQVLEICNVEQRLHIARKTRTVTSVTLIGWGIGERELRGVIDYTSASDHRL